MSGIKDTPTNFRVYYTSMKDAYTQKKEEALVVLEDLQATCKDLYATVFADFNNNTKEFPINLKDYKEFVENQYIDGKFFRTAKGILLNRKGNYELIGRNFDIYKLAETQKKIYNISNDLKFYDKLLNLTLKEYQILIKTYYTKVQEKLIIEGNGYAFEGILGWICINRCRVKNVKPHIDYKATKERKAQLLAEGKRIYNKEEAEWCKRNGLEYTAEDGRVFQDLEYVYEIPLLDCKLQNGRDIKFQTADYRGHGIRGMKNADILKESNGDKYKICQYDVDIRTKLYICLEADKTLYAKFIRNENQEASTIKQTNRKSR